MTKEEMIRKAIKFEIFAILEGNTERNPYFDTLKSQGLWEIVDKEVQSFFDECPVSLF